MNNNEQSEQLIEKVIVPQSLMNLITPPRTVDYTKWAALPLAQEFQDSADWTNNIVSSLFSDNDENKLVAMCICYKLLEKISSEEESISKKYSTLQPLKWANRLTPIISVGSQIFWSCYGPCETACTAVLAYLCTQCDQKIRVKSHAYKQHRTQLTGITNCITTITSSIKDEKTKAEIQKVLALNKLTQNKTKLKLLLALQQEEKQIREEIEKLKDYEPMQQDDN